MGSQYSSPQAVQLSELLRAGGFTMGVDDLGSRNITQWCETTPSLLKLTVLVLPAWSNRVRNLADVSTRCSVLLQGESGSQYKGYPFIVTHKSSLGVTRSHALPPEVAVRSPVDHSFTALQCSHPTLGNSLAPISVEAFPSRGALDVDGLFQQEFLRLPGLVDHRCVLPVDGMVAPPSMLCHRRLLQRLGSAYMVFPQPGF